jgi:lysine-N-methylase
MIGDFDMKYYDPAYYSEFRCIAAACPDSCCQGWDVVIDSETEDFYNSVQGEFGKKLREAIYTDPDGDRVFRLAEEKKCPFWGADHLCVIYRELGEEHLCDTCAQFPRITMDYTTFTEHTLALACPEAARLILSADDAYADFAAIDCENCEEYDADAMRFLLRVRNRAASILTASKPLAERFDLLRILAAEAQKELTGDVFECNPLSPDIFEKLEYIDEHNRETIIQAAREKADLSQHEAELTRLALYWLYRYLLGAIDTYDLIAPIRFIIGSVGIVANLAQKSGDIITAAQTYSKEIEQSYENMEELGVRS